MWTCPTCGHAFVTANIWHSCTRIDLDEPFARAQPGVRQLFDGLVALFQRCGSIVVIAQKTRIVFMVDVRFGGCVVRRDHLIANIALSRRVEHPRWSRIEEYGPRWIAHRWEVWTPADLAGDDLASLVCEGYRDLGERRSLAR